MSAGLFVLGDFKMHSGDSGRWKIECDALTDEDVECLAFMLSERLPLAFSSVYGIPTGGERMAAAMQQYATSGVGCRLIVDDVLTTGESMAQAARMMSYSTIGAVIFARRLCPRWITPLFQLAAASPTTKAGK